MKSGFVIIPFGAGAGGKIEGYTFFVDRDIHSYMKRIDSGEKPLMFMMSPPKDYELYTEIIGAMDLGGLNILDWLVMIKNNGSFTLNVRAIAAQG